MKTMIRSVFRELHSSVSFGTAVLCTDFFKSLFLCFGQEPSSEERFHVELHFSPEVKGCEDEENVPLGYGFRPASSEVCECVCYLGFYLFRIMPFFFLSLSWLSDIMHFV